jgi:Predicted integral membrane protein
MTDTGRVEAFSDGVFAIAITLLILEIKVPADLGGRSLWHALAQEWPSFAAYVVSFFNIGIMWINHHAMFRLIARVDRQLLFLNLSLLLVVAFVPFPTALMAAYLDENSPASHVAAAVFAGTSVLVAIAFTAMWRYVVRDGHLLRPGVDLIAARATVRRFGLGFFVYLATVGLAFISAPLTLAVLFLIAVYYAFDQLAVDTRPQRGSAA